MLPIGATNILNRLLFEVSTYKVHYDEQRLFRTLLSSLTSFIGLMPSPIFNESPQLLKFIAEGVTQFETDFHLSTQIQFLKLVAKVVASIGNNQLPSPLASLFKSSSPIFATIPYSQNCTLLEVNVDTVHAVFASKQVQLVSQVYLFLVDQMKQSFVQLAHESPKNIDKSERYLLFGLACLQKIACDPLDLFGVHLFTPTIFEFLSKDVRPFGGPSGLDSARNLAFNCSKIQTAIFTLLIRHMRAHSYFVANSELVESSSSMGKMAKTSKYLTKFLDELTQILASDCDFVDSNVRLLALNATTEVVNQITNYRPSLLRHETIHRILNSVVRSTAIDDREALLCAVNCLSSLFPFSKFISRRLFIDLFEICLLNVGSNDERISNISLNLVEQLAISLQTGNLLEENALPSVAEQVETDEKLLVSPFSGVLNNFTGKFRYPDFQSRQISPAMFSTVVSYLLQNTTSRPRLSNFLDIHSFTAPNGQVVTSPRFYFLTWLTALCDLASHCVMGKLKTQLGKPQDTLLAFELQFKKLAEEVLARDQGKKKLSISAATVCLDQNRRMLDLLDHLERAMYNAFEGTAVVTAPPPKHIRSFFVTNRGTCEEWLSRVRFSVMNTAIACGAYEAAVRHGFAILNDWRKNGPTTTHTIPVAVGLTFCFCKLRSPALISGLHAYSGEVCNRKLSWLKPAVTFCSERYEQCIQQAQSRLEEYINSGTPASDSHASLSDRVFIVEFLLKLSIECFESLHDWDAFELWRDGIVSQLQQSEGLEHLAKDLQTSYLTDIAGLHQFNFDNLTTSNKQVEGWSFDDVIRSIKQQNIQLIATIANETNQQRPKNFEQQSQAIRDSLSHLVKVTTSASGLPSVSCLRDIATVLMETRLISGSSEEMDISLISSLCDEFFASHICPDTSAFGGVKVNDQVSLKSAIDVITASKIKQHLSENYDCGDHCLVNAAAVRLARKQGLNNFAEKLLLSQLQNHVYLIGGEIPPETSDGCIDRLSQMPMDLLRQKCRSVFSLRCEYVKLFKENGQPLMAAEAALQLALPGLSVLQNGSNHQLIANCCARQLLLVAKWLQTDSDFSSQVTQALNHRYVGTSIKPTLVERLQLLKQLMDRSLPLSKLSLGHVMSPTEHLIGQLLAMAANQSPTSSKAWMQMAGWCHLWGRKAIADASNNGLQLSEEEYETLVQCLPAEISSDSDTFAGITKIITKLESGHISKENDGDESDYRRDSAVIEQRLLECYPQLTPETISVLLAIWRAARQRLFTLYNMAAVAYFSFVNLNPQITEQTALASLRLLRLLAKHAWELQQILENSLQSSPVGPWRAIVPQLFARLGHPEPYVRRAIADLLCRIAVTAPHDIVYPAVAGLFIFFQSLHT